MLSLRTRKLYFHCLYTDIITHLRHIKKKIEYSPHPRGRAHTKKMQAERARIDDLLQGQRYASVNYRPRVDFRTQLVVDDQGEVITRYKNFRVNDPVHGHDIVISVQCDPTSKCEVMIDGVLHAYPFLIQTMQTVQTYRRPYDPAHAVSFEVGLLVNGTFRSPPPLFYAEENRLHPANWPKSEPLAFQHPAQVQQLLDRLAEDVFIAPSV